MNVVDLVNALLPLGITDEGTAEIFAFLASNLLPHWSWYE